MAKVELDMVNNSINYLVDHLSNSVEEVEVEEIEVAVIPSNNEKWQPKKWKVEYEKVVMLDLMGLKGYEIAEKLGFTPQHVYNILGCDEAIAIQRAMVGKIRSESVDIVEELSEIQELTVKRLKHCLKDTDTFNESKLGFITKGIDVMKGMGEYLKNAPTTQVTNQFTLPPSVADKFLAGLEKSDEARALLLTKGREVGVVE